MSFEVVAISERRQGLPPDPAEVERIGRQVAADVERERREQGALPHHLTWPRASVARFRLRHLEGHVESDDFDRQVSIEINCFTWLLGR